MLDAVWRSDAEFYAFALRDEGTLRSCEADKPRQKLNSPDLDLAGNFTLIPWLIAHIQNIKPLKIQPNYYLDDCWLYYGGM